MRYLNEKYASCHRYPVQFYPIEGSFGILAQGRTECCNSLACGEDIHEGLKLVMRQRLLSSAVREYWEWI